MTETKKWNVLISGAAGFVGTSLLQRIVSQEFPFSKVVAIDIRPPAKPIFHPHYEFVQMDVRSGALRQLLLDHEITHVVHLASIVTPGPNSNRELEYSVDVLGTKNILEACVAANVSQVIVTSSGAAYGYYADNPDWIDEDQAIRGNESFAYSFHKRLVEEELALYRVKHPSLRQLILRPGTILGRDANNQITDLFRKPVILGIQGSDSPFVFIWNEDLVEVVYQGLKQNREGIYNLAGDGVLTLRQISKILSKPYLSIPAPILRAALAVLRKLGLSQYGSEQLDFLRYRPVLNNARLKTQFGFRPTHTSEESFLEFAQSAGLLTIPKFEQK